MFPGIGQQAWLTTELCDDALEAPDHLTPLQPLLTSDQQQVQQEEEEEGCSVHQLYTGTVEVKRTNSIENQEFAL